VEAITPSSRPSARSPGRGHTATAGSIALSTASPTTADHSNVVVARSTPEILRVTTLAIAQHSAHATANRPAGWNAAVPGRTTTSTPSSPTTTAAQRRSPTTSPRTGIDRMVMRAGET